MANQLIKDLELMFENVVESYDPTCTLSKEADTSYPDGKTMQRVSDTFYRPQSYRSQVVNGLDLTGVSPTDIIQRMVPSRFRTPSNVIYTLNVLEARDPVTMQRMGKAAGEDLSADVDNTLSAMVGAEGSVVVKKVGAFSWDDASLAETMLIERGVSPSRELKLFTNPTDYREIGKDLANRAYLGQVNQDAMSKAKVPDIARFRTFRTATNTVLAAVGTVTGITSASAQSFTPTAMTGEIPTDNRRMTFTVAGANLANIKNGDSFTIAGVNAVHQVNKTDTGRPMSFRVISGGGTANLVISPAIIVAGPYKNVSAVAASGAALTFLNTVSKPVNPFWASGVVTLDYGDIATPSDGGVKWMTARTEQGVPIAMGYSVDLVKGLVYIRHLVRYAATLLDPEQAGIIIANQT